MSIGVELLLANEMPKARELALDLDELNQTRKEIEAGMKLEAIKKFVKILPHFLKSYPMVLRFINLIGIKAY